MEKLNLRFKYHNLFKEVNIKHYGDWVFRNACSKTLILGDLNE